MQNLDPSLARSQQNPSLKVKMILICAGLLAGFLIAESIARVLHLGIIPAPRRVIYDGESREWCCGPEVMVGRVHRYKSNTTFEHCYSGAKRDYFDSRGCVTYHINRWGYRGQDFTLEKPADVYRIVFLGDSFTFGEGTPEPLLYTSLLKVSLEGRRIDGRRIELINLAIPGDDGTKELVTYSEFGRALAPDWVIVQWNTNDLPLSVVGEDHFRLLANRYRALFEANPWKWSRLFSTLYFNIELHSISRELVTVTKERAEKESGAFGSIGLLRSVTQADGADFTVLVFPEIIRFNDYPYATVVDLLKEYCRNEQVSTVDLLPALSQHRDRDLWVYETDHHPNRVAHAIAARELLKFVTPKLDLDSAAKKASK